MSKNATAEVVTISGGLTGLNAQEAQARYGVGRADGRAETFELAYKLGKRDEKSRIVKSWRRAFESSGV
jgi:hypothetical protein